MDSFEAYIANATAKGTHTVPGAVMAVVNSDGDYVYKHVAGYNGIAPDAQPLDFETAFFIASCTKLITSIASLQLVERGVIKLDEPTDDILPELASQPILERKPDGSFELRKAKKSVTLRHLLTHTSGTTYDWLDAKLTAWRTSRGEAPALVTNGDVANGYAYPRAYEAGTSWAYSGGLDWASLLVSRLSKKTFEEYVEENIAKPLGVTSFTWHLSRKPAVGDKLMNMSVRQDDGSLASGTTPPWSDPIGEGGGAGMYANVHDYTRVLSDLLKESPTLLRKVTVEEMFSPQLTEGTQVFKDFLASGEFAYKPTLDDSLEGVKANYGLAGLLLMEDVTRDNYFKPKGTLVWTGLPNLLWSINRERGLALMFATQVSPYGDRKCFDVVARFETAVWRNLTAKTVI